MLYKKPMSTKTFIESVIEANNDHESKMKSDSVKEASESITFLGENVIGVQATRKRTQDKYNSFMETAKSTLLQECLYKVFKESICQKIKLDNNSEVIARNLISSFIAEQGASDLLFNMRTSSLCNSSLASLVESTCKKVKDNVDLQDPNTLVLDTSIKDDFFDNLNLEDTGDVSDMISQRVADSIDEFIKSNAEDREKIKDILMDTKEKIDAVKDDSEKDKETQEEIAESWNLMGKRKITNIRSKEQNIFGEMVYSMCESAMKDNTLKLEFSTEGHINIPKIVSRVGLMYTFLEMVNTMKLVKVDEKYISDTLKSFSD